MIQSFNDLDVYKKSYALAIEINKLCLFIPSSERYDLISQMKRASKSIPANIAEGYAKKKFEKEFIKHLIIAMGSANEMEVHISFVKDFEYVPKNTAELLINDYRILGKQLHKLIDNWQTYSKV